jgi:hypothetical protein
MHDNPGMQSGSQTTLRVLACVVFAVVVLAAIAVPIVGGATPMYPPQWDPRVAPLTAKVEQLRGLKFEHPVPVRFLSDKEFEKEVGGGTSDISEGGRAEVENTAAVLRSLGLIDGGVDLAKASSQARKSGALALYSFTRKEILVRGTTLDASHRVTLAHELTHVLQDQHLNLTKLEKRAATSETGDEDAFTALVEGDAVRIEDEYRGSLSKAEQQQYDKQQDAEGARYEGSTKGVPEIVSFLLSAPYAFGPATIKVLVASGGNAAVDRAISGPTPNSQLYIQPGVLEEPDHVDAPEPPEGGEQVRPPESFGPFEFFLALGTRMDPERALTAADVVGGGQAITYKLKNQLCYRVAMAPKFETSTSFLRSALKDWAKVQKNVKVDVSGVGFTACDPGKAAKGPSHQRFVEVAQLLGIRNEFTVQAAEQGKVEPDSARCIARRFVQTPGVLPLLEIADDRRPTTAEQQQVASAVNGARRECDDDIDVGLP